MYGSRGCTGRLGALCEQNCILAGTVMAVSGSDADAGSSRSQSMVLVKKEAPPVEPQRWRCVIDYRARIRQAVVASCLVDCE
jgi:hypothetical protein